MERPLYTRELLIQKPAVLLLGTAADLAAIVHALNKDYDIEPLVYTESRFAFVPGLLRCGYRRIKYPGNEYYIIHTLLDFYSDLDAGRPPCSSPVLLIMKIW